MVVFLLFFRIGYLLGDVITVYGVNQPKVLAGHVLIVSDMTYVSVVIDLVQMFSVLLIMKQHLAIVICVLIVDVLSVGDV
jgi:hypothetical protein